MNVPEQRGEGEGVQQDEKGRNAEVKEEEG